MDKANLYALKFPIGKYISPKEIDQEMILNWIGELERLPADLSEWVKIATEDLLDTPYRPNGWTGRQVIHHLADSHINAYIRFKLALTEDQPEIRPYHEDRFAELIDYQLDVRPSLDLLGAVHTKWVILLKNISPQDYAKTYQHPEYRTITRLDDALGSYSWHGNHHLNHLKLISNHV